jgi:hypothetical protein
VSILRLQTLEPVVTASAVAVMSMTSSAQDCCNKANKTTA